MGSYMEVQTQLVIAGKLGYANSGELENVQGLASEVGRTLSATLSRLKAASNPQPLSSNP
jgi:hypothetical protein